MRRISMIALSITLVASLGHPQQVVPPASTNPIPFQPPQKIANPPRVLNTVEADFPDKARAKHMNGRCVISTTVDAQGMPQEIKLIRCTDSLFEKNSLNAVAKYRFAPATTADGNPVAKTITVEVNYRLFDEKNSITRVAYKFFALPGTTSSAPGTEGVFLLTTATTPPQIAQFVDRGYEDVVLRQGGSTACDIVLTISAKGKASDPVVTHCENAALEKPAVQSLLGSHYKPGKVNGKAVPIRASVHLEYAGSSFAN